MACAAFDVLRPRTTALTRGYHYCSVGLMYSGDVGLVIERSRVRLPAGALPGNLGQLSLPSLRSR